MMEEEFEKKIALMPFSGLVSSVTRYGGRGSGWCTSASLSSTGGGGGGQTLVSVGCMYPLVSGGGGGKGNLSTQSSCCMGRDHWADALACGEWRRDCTRDGGTGYAAPPSSRLHSSIHTVVGTLLLGGVYCILGGRRQLVTVLGRRLHSHPCRLLAVSFVVDGHRLGVGGTRVAPCCAKNMVHITSLA
ncbi:hypothetical protein JZ751_004569 [Albula glossodonta]|uniref:Uncharacterized protein n=1 Tax=Albula glossodonta TaxID=121402 RepID=A0A8T2MN80_9TELE|nr:hypothetical protein JZ751_004569 [Albula glossodonta]